MLFSSPRRSSSFIVSKLRLVEAGAWGEGRKKGGRGREEGMYCLGFREGKMRKVLSLREGMRA